MSLGYMIYHGNSFPIMMKDEGNGIWKLEYNINKNIFQQYVIIDTLK
jgi:hypothetical protein